MSSTVFYLLDELNKISRGCVCSVFGQHRCLCCVYLLYLVYDEVAFVAQDSGRLSVLFGQQVEPLGQSVHHGQNDGP